MGNGLSGLAVNTSDSRDERYDLHLSDSTVSDNHLGGVDVVTTSGGNSGYGSSLHSLQFRNNVMSRNGQLPNGTQYLDVKSTGGLAMRLDKSNVVVQNNTFESNRGGGIAIQLDWDSEDSFINVSNNRINENIEGAAVSLFGPTIGTMFGSTESPSSGTTGARASVLNNSISHNSPGVQHDTLSIADVNASVTGNTFFNNTCRYVIYWKTDSWNSVTDQSCSENTLYQNAGLNRNYRWTILADGVATTYNRNIFFNPANIYEFVAGNDLRQGNHDVRNNWWGPRIANVGEAEKRVLDKSDGGFRARVDIQPIDTVNPWFNTSGNCVYLFASVYVYQCRLIAVCPPDWRAIASICYLYVQDARSWSAARAYCQASNANIVCLYSSSISVFDF